MPEAGGLRHNTGAMSLPRLALCIASLACLGPVACATVPPAERGQLARPEMNPDDDELQAAFEAHVEAARSGAAGGNGAKGGGCGCG